MPANVAKICATDWNFMKGSILHALEWYELISLNWQIDPESFPASEYTLDAYMWAWGIIWSLGVNVEFENGRSEYLIPPLTSLIRHSSEGSSVWDWILHFFHFSLLFCQCAIFFSSVGVCECFKSWLMFISFLFFLYLFCSSKMGFTIDKTTDELVLVATSNFKGGDVVWKEEKERSTAILMIYKGD